MPTQASLFQHENVFERDEDDEPEDERSYVDFLDFTLMETTGTDGGGEEGRRRRANAVAEAQRAFDASLGKRDICPSCADAGLLF